MISIYALLHRPGNGGVGWSSLFFYCLQTQGKTSALRLSVGIPIGLSDGIQGVKGFSTSVQRPSSRLAMIQQEPGVDQSQSRRRACLCYLPSVSLGSGIDPAARYSVQSSVGSTVLTPMWCNQIKSPTWPSSFDSSFRHGGER